MAGNSRLTPSTAMTAKAIEDTLFYRDARLVSLNEVGGDPASFGVSASAFHGANRDRRAHWPHTLLATSTHDHKRSDEKKSARPHRKRVRRRNGEVVARDAQS